MVRPADVDPSRQREWCRLEDQRELNDIITAIRSAMPGAVLIGDYAVESGDRVPGERIRNGSATDRGRWLSTLFLFQMIGSLEDGATRRGGRSRGVLGHRNAGQGAAVPPSRRRYLWGENLLGLQDEVVDLDEEEEDDEEEEGESDDEPDLNVPSDLGDNRRRRPRLGRDQSNEDHPL